MSNGLRDVTVLYENKSSFTSNSRCILTNIECIDAKIQVEYFKPAKDSSLYRQQWQVSWFVFIGRFQTLYFMINVNTPLALFL